MPFPFEISHWLYNSNMSVSQVCFTKKKRKDLVKANKSKHVKLPSFFIFSKKTKVHCVCVLNFESPLYNYPKTVEFLFVFSQS